MLKQIATYNLNHAPALLQYRQTETLNKAKKNRNPKPPAKLATSKVFLY